VKNSLCILVKGFRVPGLNRFCRSECKELFLTRECGLCGKTFVASRFKQDFCSGDCREQSVSSWRRELRQCECGKKFYPSKPLQKYCTKECAKQHVCVKKSSRDEGDVFVEIWDGPHGGVLRKTKQLTCLKCGKVMWTVPERRFCRKCRHGKERAAVLGLPTEGRVDRTRFRGGWHEGKSSHWYEVVFNNYEKFLDKGL